MGETKREALRNRMFYLLNDEEEELKKKKLRELQLKRKEEARKRKIYDCDYLGFRCEIGNRSIEDMYYRNNYI